MPRRAKALHVITTLRKKLAPASGGLTQEEFAERVGLSRRTIQNIEYGKIPLSRKNAVRISEVTGVSQDWLLANDPSRPVTAIDGRHEWAPKYRRSEALFGALPHDRLDMIRFMRTAGVCPPLLQAYLKQRNFFTEKTLLSDPSILRRWCERQEQAWDAFLKSEPGLDEDAKQNRPQKLDPDTLQCVREDVDVVGGFLDKVGQIEG